MNKDMSRVFVGEETLYISRKASIVSSLFYFCSYSVEMFNISRMMDNSEINSFIHIDQESM